MSIWFVVPILSQTNMRTQYRAAKESEVLGTLHPNKTGTLGFTGTSRMTMAEAEDLRALIPGIQIHTSWPAPGWEPPDPTPGPRP